MKIIWETIFLRFNFMALWMSEALKEINYSPLFTKVSNFRPLQVFKSNTSNKRKRLPIINQTQATNQKVFHLGSTIIFFLSLSYFFFFFVQRQNYHFPFAPIRTAITSQQILLYIGWIEIRQYLSFPSSQFWIVQTSKK